MYLKEKQYKNAMILLCPVQGPWASSLFEDIVNIRNERLIFLRSWEMNLGEAVTNLPRTAKQFTGFVTCLTQVHFPMNAEKRHSFLKRIVPSKPQKKAPEYIATALLICIVIKYELQRQKI